MKENLKNKGKARTIKWGRRGILDCFSHTKLKLSTKLSREPKRLKRRTTLEKIRVQKEKEFVENLEW